MKADVASHKETENLTRTSSLDTMILPKELIPNATQFKSLWDLHPEEHAEVMIYGRLTPIPRWQRSYGKDYKFSGVVSKGFPLPDLIKPYLDYANSLGYGEFNEVLLNWYNGSHYIGSHADDEKQLNKNSPIVTITLCLPGEPRKFRIRDKKTKDIVKDVLTTNGLVLVMCGEFQKEFKHEVVRLTGGSIQKAGDRISITLRQFSH